MSEYKKKIEEFILEWWNYPSKEDMDNFIHQRDCSYDTARLQNALEELMDENQILYDDKHDSYLWIQEMTEEQKKNFAEVR